MKYIFLNEEFYEIYNKKNYPEIEQKLTRPYIMIKVTIDELDFGIPLRSKITHPNVLWTNKENRCGADYSKAVLILDNKYIDERQPYIRPDEHKALKGKEYLLKTGFEKYINKYKKALTKQHIKTNQKLCKYSTLQYYHQELGMKEERMAQEQIAITKESKKE